MREQRPPHYTNSEHGSSQMGIPTIAFWVLAGIAGIFALTGAYIWGMSNASVTEVDILIPTPQPVIVQVVGEVFAPGVYELNTRDRVFTAIGAAGGPTNNADIEKINLAAFIKDGARIYVPSVPETSLPTPQNQIQIDGANLPAASSFNAPPLAATLTPNTEPIDLNIASIEQLISLPGIGETRAKQIIDHRDALGGFTTIEQLLDINGIGDKTIEGIRTRVVIR